MPFFKDTNGRDWRIRLTGPALSKIREATGIRLADPSGQGAVAATADGEILTRVLWLLCSDQEPRLTPEQFAEAVASGDVFERARDAIHEAVADFTPPSQRTALTKALETEKEVQAAAQRLTIEKLESGDGLKDQIIEALRVGMDRNIAEILTKLRNAGGSPDSPELTPTEPLTASLT